MRGGGGQIFSLGFSLRACSSKNVLHDTDIKLFHFFHVIILQYRHSKEMTIYENSDTESRQMMKKNMVKENTIANLYISIQITTSAKKLIECSTP